MQVILLERVEKLGVPGAIVDVKRGYARNWLLPQGKALIATKENIKTAEKEKQQILARDSAKKAEAETVKQALGTSRVFLIRAAGESGQLYGSVRDADIAQAIEQQVKILVNKKFVVLQQPIRTLGISPVKLALHPQVDIRIEVNVAQSEDEAKTQAIKHDREIAKQKAEEKNKSLKPSRSDSAKRKDAEVKDSGAEGTEVKGAEVKGAEAEGAEVKGAEAEGAGQSESSEKSGGEVA